MVRTNSHTSGVIPNDDSFEPCNCGANSSKVKPVATRNFLADFLGRSKLRAPTDASFVGAPLLYRRATSSPPCGTLKPTAHPAPIGQAEVRSGPFSPLFHDATTSTLNFPGVKFVRRVPSPACAEWHKLTRLMCASKPAFALDLHSAT